MRLAEFIDQARDQIVAESVAYAEQLPILSGQAIEVLRDHLPLVLDAIARDMEQPQTRAESIAKSHTVTGRCSPRKRPRRRTAFCVRAAGSRSSGTRIVFDSAGDTEGEFDSARVREALANLIGNAAQHGSAGSPVAVTVTGGDQAVQVSVDNESDPIPTEELQSLFEPLRRHANDSDTSDRNLGRGLFIVREIARAHGGDATASMAGRRVSFNLLLPKIAPSA